MRCHLLHRTVGQFVPPSRPLPEESLPTAFLRRLESCHSRFQAGLDVEMLRQTGKNMMPINNGHVLGSGPCPRVCANGMPTSQQYSVLTLSVAVWCANAATSPDVRGSGGWEWAVSRAKLVVSQMTLEEKANMTGGIGSNEKCEGLLGQVERFGIPEICFQDGPKGIRASDFVTVFPAGLTTAATFNRALMEKRGSSMASEFKGKDINVLLGPVTGGPLGRSPYQGR